MISVNVVTRLPRHYSTNGQVIPESFVQWQGGETMIIRRIGEIAREQGLASGRAEKAELIKAIQRKQGNFDRLATASNGGGDRTGCLWRKIVWPRPGSGRIPEAGGIGEAKEVPCF